MPSWMKAALPFVLGLAAAAALITNWPVTTDALSAYSTVLLIVILLTVLASYFSVTLSAGELSAAHVGGMLGLLAAGSAALPVLMWGMFIAALGSLAALKIREWVHPNARQLINSVGDALLLIARLVLSLWGAEQAYSLLTNGQPLRTLSDIASNGAGLFAFIVLYVAIYLLIYSVEGIRTKMRFSRQDIYRVVVVMALPVPFTILGAEILNRLGPTSQAMFVISLMFILIALHGLSRSEFQLRRQLSESHTMAAISGAMRSHLELDILLQTLYVQIAHLLEVDHFIAVLRDNATQKPRYAMVMRKGQAHRDLEGQIIEDEHSLIARVFESEAPLLISRDVHAATITMGLTPPDTGVMSWLGVPLQAGGKVLGVIAVISRSPQRLFDSEDLRRLTSIGLSSSIAMENAMLYQQQKTRTEQLVILNRVSTVLGRSLSFEAVADAVISAASMLTQAHAVALHLYNNDEKLMLAYSGGLSAAYLASVPQPLITEITGFAPPLAIERVNTDRRADPLRESLQHEGIESYFELPLRVGEQNIGIMALYYRNTQTFDGDTIELYKTFANQAAQSILNARTYASTDEAFQRSSEQLGSLSEIGRLLTSRIDLKDVGDLVLNYAASAAHVERGFVALVNDSTDALEIIAARGFSQKTLIDRSTLKFEDKLVQSRALMGSETLAAHGSYVTQTDAYSVLVVPIRLADEVIGLVRLENDRYTEFNAETIEFIEQLTNQGVIAIENARLFDRIAKDRDRLQVLLDAMEEGIIAIDLRGEITLANPRIDLIGLQPEDLIRKKIDQLAPEALENLAARTGFRSADELTNLVKKAQDAANAASVNYVVSGAEGDLYLRRQIIPIRDAQGTIYGLLIVLYNKTEEQELVRSREELSSMIVHDLRSPLTAITTSLKLLSDHVPRETDFYKLVESTTDASRRAVRKMMRRVDSLLDISKMESGQANVDRAPVKIETLIDNVFLDVRPLAQELEIPLVKELFEGYPMIYADSDKVERLIQNLLDNALKYNPMEQPITVRSFAPGERGAAAGYIRIDVVDHGPGVPDDYKERLFEPFVQIEGRRKVRRGVGLGLAFCRMVVMAHGGHIWIEDNPAGGSIFAFTMPVLLETSQQQG